MESIDHVLVALRQVIRATDLHSRQLAKATGLTAPQMLLMQSLQQQGAMTVGDLAKTMNLSQATVTSIIDRLVKRGLVARERSSEDKRRVYVTLEQEGQAMLVAAPVPLQNQLTRRYQALPDWEQHMILAALQRVASLMDAEDIDAAPVLDVGQLDRQNAG